MMQYNTDMQKKLKDALCRHTTLKYHISTCLCLLNRYTDELLGVKNCLCQS